MMAGARRGTRVRRSSRFPQPHHLPLMPLKRASSSKKRKASASDSEEERSTEPISAKKAKKAKTAAPSADSETAPNGQPTNKVLPVTINFPPRISNTLRIASWNICGLSASQKKVRRISGSPSLVQIGVCAGFQILRGGGRPRYLDLDGN